MERTVQSEMSSPRHLAEVEPSRILVADDDTELRHLIVAVLAGDGYSVVEASNGRELLDRLGGVFIGKGPGAEYDLIVSDVCMPGPNGLMVLAALRTAEVMPPVVLMTAFGDEEFHADARALGAAASLNKPFDMDDLRTLVCHLLNHTERL